MKKQLPIDEITKIIQRQNVITFKRKNEQRSAKSQKQQEEQIESKNNINAQDTSFHRINKKNSPLPQIFRQKKRMIIRNIPQDNKNNSNCNYIEKQVRQHDNILLKNNNNFLTDENMKLKTKNMNLEKQIIKLQKIIQQDPVKSKIISIKQSKPKGNQIVNLKSSVKNLIKEIEDLKKENIKIKTSVKFTTINELSIQCDAILEETQRLREMLEQQKNKTLLLKTQIHKIHRNQQVFSSLEQKINQLQQKNIYLTRQNNQLKSKLSKIDEKEKNNGKSAQNEKNLGKMLLNAKKLIKDKEKQLQLLKIQLKKVNSTGKVDSVKIIDKQQIAKKRSFQTSKIQNSLNEQTKNYKQKRLMSKSAQKYRSTVPIQVQQCQKCYNLKTQNIQLQKQIQILKKQLQNKNNHLNIIKHPATTLCKNPIAIPKDDQKSTIKRFLIHRFQAHHLSLSQAILHLINYQGHDQNLQTDISVTQLVQISMAEPFSIISNRYIQVFITCMFYSQNLSSTIQFITLSQTKKLKKKQIKQKFIQFIGIYQVTNQMKQQQMFIQIAQLITQYQQNILKALSQKRNSQNTINQKDFYKFFKQIKLEEEYIRFMISQIILESIDLDHLNIYNLFQIFYMPPPPEQIGYPNVNNPGFQPGKKYNFIQSIVKEQDEQYQQSKSFHESRQKSLSKHEKSQDQLNKQQEQSLEQYDNQIYQNSQQQTKQIHDEKVPKIPQYFIQNNEEQYIEQYDN